MKLSAIVLVFSLVLLATVYAQGPTPPRLSIPGAVPIPARHPLQGSRNERVIPGPNGIVRIRRPLNKPSHLSPFTSSLAQPAPIEEAKPVTEEPEEEQAPFIPQIVQQQQQQHQQQHQQQQQQQKPLFLSEAYNNAQSNSASSEESNENLFSRFGPQDRPSPSPINSGAQRFALERPAPKQNVRQRVQFREPRPTPQYVQPEPEQYAPAPRRPAPRPVEHNNNEIRDREKKPVAQILRKYREENEDGSITWGFENDDGSFKEETIGNDCVTRGRYGYVDPDGVKREYNYETGIQCDPNKRGQEEDDEINDAYIDYQENKMVLPNGSKIDLNSFGNHKSRRPAQQSYYQN